MKKSVLLLLAGAFAMTSACTGNNPFSSNEPLMSSSRNVDKATGQEKPVPPNFAQFSDIPVPENAQMDLTKTLVFGGQNQWMGRLVISAPYSQGSLFDFYLAEMPKFGWTEVTVVRSKASVLTFSQGERVATIQLDGDASNTQVFFTVSPAVAGGSRSKIKTPAY